MKQKIQELWQKTKDKGFILKLSLIPFACGLLYAIAGSDNTPKQIRRFGIPALLTIVSWFFLKNIWALTMLSQIGVYHIGHGIPSIFYPEDETRDAGSTLGRFWTMLFRKLFISKTSSILYSGRVKAHKYGDYCVRGTKALLIAVSCLVIPVLRGNWAVYMVASTLMVGLIASVAWRALGEKKITIGSKIYTVLYVDSVVGTIIGFYVMLLLRF